MQSINPVLNWISVQSINPALNICVSSRLRGCKLLGVWLAMCCSRFVWRLLQNKWSSQNQAAAMVIWISFSSFSFHIPPSSITVLGTDWRIWGGVVIAVSGKGRGEWPAGRCQWQVCRAVSLMIFHRSGEVSCRELLSQSKAINPGNLALLLYLDHVFLVKKWLSSENLTSVSVRLQHLSNNAFYYLYINSSVFSKRTLLHSSIAGVICSFF